MLTKRLTETRPVVSLSDPALLEADVDLVGRYGISRDFELIKDIAKTATVFHVKPLSPKYEHLCDQVLSGAAAASWNLFKTHVRKVDRFDGLEWNETGDKLLDKSHDLLTLNVITEIATVIVQLANEVSQGFTLPASWLDVRTRYHRLRVLDATGSAGQKSK